MVKVKVEVTVNVYNKAMVMVLGSQIRFPRNLLKIRQAGASELVILQQVKFKVMVKVKVKVKVKVNAQIKVMVMVPGSQIRFPENLVKIRQAGASE